MIGAVILLFVVFVILIGSHFVLKKISPNVVTECSYLVAKAGSIDGTVRPMRTATSIANLNFVSEGQSIRALDYVPYIVDGESMSNNGIHTNDIILTEDLFGDNRLNLRKNMILVFTYNDCDESGSIGYKLRQFIDYIRINEPMDVDDWCANHGIEEISQFKLKLEKAKKRETHDSEVYLCSKTWHENMLDYSFHSIINLKGRVRYIIPFEKLK